MSDFGIPLSPEEADTLRRVFGGLATQDTIVLSNLLIRLHLSGEPELPAIQEPAK